MKKARESVLFSTLFALRRAVLLCSDIRPSDELYCASRSFGGEYNITLRLSRKI